MTNSEQVAMVNPELQRLTDQAVIVLGRRESPIIRSRLSLDQELSDEFEGLIYISDDTHQEGGSFKARGAENGLYNFTYTERRQGIHTASAGNFGAGLANSSNLAGIRNRYDENIKTGIWVPIDTPDNKRALIKTLGGDYVELYDKGQDFDECQELARLYCEENGENYLSPFDNMNVMAGNGTWGREAYQDLASLGKAADVVIIPKGGGGLLTGFGTAMINEAVINGHNSPEIIAVEPEEAASWQHARELGKPAPLEGEIDTTVDGVSVRQVGELPFKLIDKLITEVVTVSTLDTRKAITYLWDRHPPVPIEMTAGMILAAIRNNKDLVRGKTTVLLWTGKNLSLKRFEEEVRV